MIDPRMPRENDLLFMSSLRAWNGEPGYDAGVDPGFRKIGKRIAKQAAVWPPLSKDTQQMPKPSTQGLMPLLRAQET
jgi:hypothetical protein